MALTRKNLWRLRGDLSLEEDDVVMDEETGKAVFCYAKKGNYCGLAFMEEELKDVEFFDTKEQAETARQLEVKNLKAMMPKVRKFLMRMKHIREDNSVMPFKREDYLGNYAEERQSSYYKEYCREQEYAGRLETFIRSRMVNIDDQMVPIGDVKNGKWYRKEDGDECEGGDIQAELTLKDDTEIKTQSESEVKICLFVFGRNYGPYFTGEFYYDKED